ncbi:unnamed protein product, partial [Rotaria magnacalcarata]
TLGLHRHNVKGHEHHRGYEADQTNSNTTLNIDKNLAHDHVHHQNMRQASQEKSNISNQKFERKNSSKGVAQVTGWMIILEDGIHNFADGLAIETIFSELLMCKALLRP